VRLETTAVEADSWHGKTTSRCGESRPGHWQDVPQATRLGLRASLAVSSRQPAAYDRYAAYPPGFESAYPKLIHYNRLPKGGHFAAWEQPQLLSEELRAAFRSLR
jgi:hypothetical protein